MQVACACVCTVCVCMHVCVLCVCMWLLIYVYCVYLSNQFWSCTKVLWPYVFNSKSQSFYTLFILSIHNSAGEMPTLYRGNYTKITGSFSTKLPNSIAELHGLKLYHLHTFINLINLHIGIKKIYFKLCTKMPALYERNSSLITGSVSVNYYITTVPYCITYQQNTASIFKVTNLL